MTKRSRHRTSSSRARSTRFRIELPSWGFANTGTRFGKFLQPAAATTIEEKLATPARCTRSPALSDGRLARAVGPSRRARRMSSACASRRARAGVRAGRDQSESLSGSGLQVRLVRQSGRRGPRRARSTTASTASRSRGASAAATSRCGSPTARTIPARPDIRERKRWFAEGLAERARGPRTGSADARRIQAVRAGVLSHRHRRLGHGAAAGARGGPAGEGAGRHRASLSGRRTSSRSSPGCSTKTCSAASTSTIAATPTTI